MGRCTSYNVASYLSSPEVVVVGHDGLSSGQGPKGGAHHASSVGEGALGEGGADSPAYGPQLTQDPLTS